MRVDANQSEPPSEREVVVTRHFDVPASVVFEAFTKAGARDALVRAKGMASDDV
jgi:hypothetical protein